MLLWEKSYIEPDFLSMFLFDSEKMFSLMHSSMVFANQSRKWYQTDCIPFNQAAHIMWHCISWSPRQSKDLPSFFFSGKNPTHNLPPHFLLSIDKIEHTKQRHSRFYALKLCICWALIANISTCSSDCVYYFIHLKSACLKYCGENHITIHT